MRQRRNDIEYAKLLYDNGFESDSKNINEQMRLLAIYFRDELNLKPAQREEKLKEYCVKYIHGYRYETYYKLIDKAIWASRKKENKLIYIPYVNIYSEE
jgi:hypothetical protein